MINGRFKPSLDSTVWKNRQYNGSGSFSNSNVYISCSYKIRAEIRSFSFEGSLKGIEHIWNAQTQSWRTNEVDTQIYCTCYCENFGYTRRQSLGVSDGASTSVSYFDGIRLIFNCNFVNTGGGFHIHPDDYEPPTGYTSTYLTLSEFPDVIWSGYQWRMVEGEPRIEDMPDDTEYTLPMPKAQWRIEQYYNNGFPWNELIPEIPYNPPPPTPTIDPVEFYDEYNAEYLSALYQKHRRYKVRLELLGYYENVVGEITRDLSRGASGSITINNEQITRRSCNLSLINVEKKYLPSPDSPIWFNRKFKLWIGIVTGKHTYWWSYGVFFTTKATCDGATLNIQGIDKGGALDGTIKTGMLDAENVIERGTTLTNVIKDTLMWNEFSSPYLNHNTGSSSYPVDPIKPIIDTKFDSITTQAEITINANDYISTLFSSIADGYGADAYYNTNGHFVFQTMADSSRIDGYRFMSRQWNFADTDEMYSNASIEYNLDGFNVVTVYTNESTLENVSYTAANNNPASPLRLDSAGIRRMSDIEIPYVNVSQDEMQNRCKAYADYLLMKEAMDRMSLTFSCPIIPHLDVNRTIGVTDKRYNLESATFIINSITMPLSAESMTINATQIAWLPDDTSIEGGAD